MNSVMTAGLHHRWRARAADLAELAPGDRALDVACGTGDLALELAGRVGPGGEVVACDFSEQMLELARAKARQADADRSAFEWANALELPYERRRVRRGDGRLRRAQLLRPRARPVARWRASCGPAGKVVILEITTPTRPPLSTFFRVWFDRVVPALGRVAGDARRLHLPAELGPALPRAAASWPPRWSAAACATIRYVLTAGGIIAIHVGEVA